MPSTTLPAIHIRWMIRRDISSVLRIERQSFDAPWDEDDFLRCLRRRNCIGMVVEQEECIVGSMMYELEKSHLHLLNFAVAPEVRLSYVGSQMVGKLISKLHTHRRPSVVLEVAERNLAGQLFFRANGFRATRVLHGWYAESGEHAYRMEYRTTLDGEQADRQAEERWAGV